MKLSIIIPYFNTPNYTPELLNVLGKQVTEETEVILVDDGSTDSLIMGERTDEGIIHYWSWLKVIRTRHGGQSKARNRGLKEAKGEYIQFIDSDDLVSENFISKILEKIEEGNELIEFSWRSLNTNKFNFHITEGERLTMPSVVTRTFKRSYIGSARFNEKKDAAEDEDFSRQLGYLYKPVSVSVISDYLYFYRDEVPGSNVKSFKAGQTHTKRITYYVPHVTDPELIEQIKKDDEENEVILLTEQNDLPELKRYCQIMKPCRIWTHYQKGFKYPLEIIPVPVSSQVIVYIGQMCIIGGIETFVVHFVQVMKDYDITLVVGNLPEQLADKLRKYAKLVLYNPSTQYECDTLVMLRILDAAPKNIKFNQSVQMCHACRTNPRWHIKQGTDFVVNVSEASKKSFEAEAKDALVIHNPITPTEEKALILVSATRIPAPDKGDNEKRMRRLAEMLNEAEIPFLWLNFSNGPITNPPRGLVNVGIVEDMRPYIKKADYLVQLSDSEAWSYSILEALTQNVPVIVTDFPSAREMGIKDGENGFILPFSLDFDVKRLLNVPIFHYEYDNEIIKRQWRQIFDHKIRKKAKKMVEVQVIQQYNDLEIGRMLFPGEKILMPIERARKICDLGYVKF